MRESSEPADRSERGCNERVWDAFWSRVLAEVAQADARELARFMRAAALPFELRPGFEQELWTRLRRGLLEGA